jgi:hypothetical protein
LYRGDYNIQDFIINYLLKGENKWKIWKNLF